MFWKIIFAGNLIVLSLDHLITGSIAIFSPKRAVALYERLFGARVPLSDPVILLLKPWGALGIFAAIVTIYPILNPERYIGVLIALISLLVVRIYIRLRNRTAGNFQLNLDRGRNYFHVALIALCAILILGEVLMVR